MGKPWTAARLNIEVGRAGKVLAKSGRAFVILAFADNLVIKDFMGDPKGLRDAMIEEAVKLLPYAPTKSPAPPASPQKR